MTKFSLILGATVVVCLLTAAGWGQSEKQEITSWYKKAHELKSKHEGKPQQETERGQEQPSTRSPVGEIGLAPKTVGEANKLVREGRALRDKATSLDDLKKALTNFEAALETFTTFKSDEGKGLLLREIADIHRLVGRRQTAVEYYEKSLCIFEKMGNTKAIGNILDFMGQLHKADGKYQEALEYYEKGLAMARKLRDVRQERVVLYNMADVYRRSGLYPKALELYEKALAIKQKDDDSKLECDALTGLGTIYAFVGQRQIAKQCHEKALHISMQTDNYQGQAESFHHLGEIHHYFGERQKALEFHKKELMIREKSRMDKNFTLVSMANLYLSMDDVGRAEQVLGQTKFESNESDVAIKMTRARLCLMQSRFLDAARQLAMSGKPKHTSGTEEKPRNIIEEEVAYEIYRGLAFEGVERYNLAADHFAEAVERTEQIRDSLLETLRANFYEATVRYVAKITPYESLCRVLQKLGKSAESFKAAEATRTRVFSESLSKRSQISLFDVPNNVLDGDSQLSDKLAALVQRLEEAQLLEGRQVPRRWLSQYEVDNLTELMRSERERSLRVPRRQQESRVLESLAKQIKEARQEKEIHIARLRKEYPLFAATKYPQPMGLDESALRDNEWVLEYEVTDSGIVIFLIKGKKIVKSLFKQVERKELDALVKKFREPLDLDRKKLLAFDFVTAKKLKDLLLADILNELPKGVPLIVVPDDSLGTLPFEALVLNDSGKAEPRGKLVEIKGADFFGDRNPISYQHSVTALTLARNLGRRDRPGNRTLAIVDPVFTTDDRRLVKTAAEKRRALLDKISNERLMSIKTELGISFSRLPRTGELGESLKKADPTATDLYEGMEAQKKILFEKDLTPYKYCVFATHGYFGKDIPVIQEPVLVLTLSNQPEGQDGFLRMSEVMGLKLNADMVALTACQSGLGRTISGEGTMGMGRAFQYAGAKSVLMSLWSVAESSSVDLVTKFFKHLREGKSKLEALKLAREEIRKAGYDHPFFWAPFILVGEAN